MYLVGAETHACAKDAAHGKKSSSGMLQLRPLQEHGLGSVGICARNDKFNYASGIISYLSLAKSPGYMYANTNFFMLKKTL
jgi:hypothetical protein